MTSIILLSRMYDEEGGKLLFSLLVRDTPPWYKVHEKKIPQLCHSHSDFSNTLEFRFLPFTASKFIRKALQSEKLNDCFIKTRKYSLSC